MNHLSFSLYFSSAVFVVQSIDQKVDAFILFFNRGTDFFQSFSYKIYSYPLMDINKMMFQTVTAKLLTSCLMK